MANQENKLLKLVKKHVQTEVVGEENEIKNSKLSVLNDEEGETPSATSLPFINLKLLKPRRSSAVIEQAEVKQLMKVASTFIPEIVEVEALETMPESITNVVGNDSSEIERTESLVSSDENVQDLNEEVKLIESIVNEPYDTQNSITSSFNTLLEGNSEIEQVQSEDYASSNENISTFEEDFLSKEAFRTGSLALPFAKYSLQQMKGFLFLDFFVSAYLSIKLFVIFNKRIGKYFQLVRLGPRPTLEQK